MAGLVAKEFLESCCLGRYVNIEFDYEDSDGESHYIGFDEHGVKYELSVSWAADHDNYGEGGAIDCWVRRADSEELGKYDSQISEELSAY